MITCYLWDYVKVSPVIKHAGPFLTKLKYQIHPLEMCMNQLNGKSKSSLFILNVYDLTHHEIRMSNSEYYSLKVQDQDTEPQERDDNSTDATQVRTCILHQHKATLLCKK